MFQTCESCSCVAVEAVARLGITSWQIKMHGFANGTKPMIFSKRYVMGSIGICTNYKIMQESIVSCSIWAPGKELWIVRYHEAHERQRHNYDGLLTENDRTCVEIMTHHMLILTVLWRSSFKNMSDQKAV